MEIKKRYKNYGVLKKEIFEEHGSCYGRVLKIRCFTDEDYRTENGNPIITTCLDIDIYTEDGDCINTFTPITVESIDETDDQFDEIMSEHRLLLLKEKKRLYKYLSQHFQTVESAEDYTA